MTPPSKLTASRYLIRNSLFRALNVALSSIERSTSFVLDILVSSHHGCDGEQLPGSCSGPLPFHASRGRLLGRLVRALPAAWSSPGARGFQALRPSGTRKARCRCQPDPLEVIWHSRHPCGQSVSQGPSRGRVRRCSAGFCRGALSRRTSPFEGRTAG